MRHIPPHGHSPKLTLVKTQHFYSGTNSFHLENFKKFTIIFLETDMAGTGAEFVLKPHSLEYALFEQNFDEM